MMDCIGELEDIYGSSRWGVKAWYGMAWHWRSYDTIVVKDVNVAAIRDSIVFVSYPSMTWGLLQSLSYY